MWAEFLYHDTMRALINFLFMLNHSLFKERPPGKLFPISTNIVFKLPTLTCIHPKCIDSGSMQLLFSSLSFSFFFFQKPLSATLCIFQSENSGITGMWQDWISAGWLDCLFALSQAALSGRGFGRIKRWWMPPPYVWTAPSWPQQKPGKAKKKKACDLLTRPVKAEGRMNATQLPRLTDVKKCSHCFSVCRFPSLFLSTAFGRERTAWRKLRRVIITCWKSQDFVISYQTHFTPHLMFPVYSFSPR